MRTTCAISSRLFALAILVLAVGASACASPTSRGECTRDGDCPDEAVCLYDDKCAPRHLAERKGAEIGDECVVSGGREIGCEEDEICRMGFCEGELDAGTPDAVISDDGAATSDGGPELCTAGVLGNLAPFFGGVSTATPDGVDAAVLNWFGAADETLPADITYLVFMSTVSGGHDFSAPAATVVGVTSHRIDGLTTGTTYYFVVRAQDAEGQVECNTNEQSATPDVVSGCIDFDADIATIFDSQCISCHSGADPPQGLYLDSYAGVMAGGATGNEIVACKPDSSLLYQKVTQSSPPVGSRMPLGGPYLTSSQTDTIRLWIEQGATTSCPIDPLLCSDSNPPTFGGITTATLTNDTTAHLCWTAGSDDVTATGDLVYDVYQATNPGGEDYGSPPLMTSAAGATCVDSAGLTPNQQYCWVVRARDAAGNSDANTIELCVTTPPASCIEYAAMIQPIFDAECVHCHSGALAPQGLLLDSYAGVIAGGATGDEVVACQSASSLLFQKVSMGSPPVGGRMPADGPPYLSVAQISAIEQWIDEGGRASCAGPDICSDTNPPTFGGITTASLTDDTTAHLCWTAGDDDVTLPGDLVYLVYQAFTSGGQDYGAPPLVTTAAGATCVDSTGLAPNQEYCWVVRARDGAGNTDTNTTEMCLTTPPASCIEYTTIIQPIFDAECTHCHSGPVAPQGLVLDSYAGVMAGGATGDEVVACQSASSLLFQKVSMSSPPVGGRMPDDGPPYLSAGQIAAIEQWIDEGGRASCAGPDICSDTNPPTFGGITTASLTDDTTAHLCWTAGDDDVTLPGDLVYLVYQAFTSGGQDYGAPPLLTTAAGALCVDSAGLAPNQEYCWVVRARDTAGNTDINTTEMCLTTPSASCIDYATIIQPIFDAECVHCHSGVGPPQGLYLDSYSGVMAGGATGDEVVACQSASSLLFQKVSMSSPPVGGRMPDDGPPYLSAGQIAAIEQWIDEGGRASCAGPDICSDVNPPTFGGISTASLTDDTTAQLCWTAGDDDVTLPGDLVYLVYQAFTSGGQDYGAPPLITTIAGTTCVSSAGLAPNQEYCWVVRARDGAGNTDTNVTEQCLTTPSASCIDYATIIQPIFDAECIHCHSGASPPQGLYLDSYAGVIAGGATGDEVVACQSASSFLFQKVSMSPPPIGGRMPDDGPPYLSAGQIAAIEQWIDEGGRASCAGPDICSDVNPPTFGGISVVNIIDATTAELCWLAGDDDITLVDDLVYLAYQATTSGGQDFVALPRATSGAGDLCVMVNALSPNQQYCWVVRARDGAGNVETNTTEECVTMPPVPAGCVIYDDMIQPLFEFNCTRCHSGTRPPQWLRLDSYDNVIAGSVQRNEVIACNSGGSLLVEKISASPSIGAQMPLDGPPYLTASQIAMVAQWIDNGAQRTCAESATCGDGTAPSFAGAVTATALDETSIEVCWVEAVDDQTPTPSIRYDVYEAASSGGQSYDPTPPQSTVTGTDCITVSVGPNTNMCFVVRARDLRDNRDSNTVEVCATTMSSTCAIEYDDLIQPILSARCTHCHGNYRPRRYLELTSHGATLAGGSLREEVLGCDWGGSLLNTKTAGNVCGERMPFDSVDGAPWLAPSERSLLQRWIESGARRSCADADPCGDGAPPTFAGATSATALDPTLVEVCWDPATDGTTETDAIVYEIFEAASSGGQTLGRPASYAASGGATCFEIPTPNGATSCYVVRARDLAGNRDTNSVERCATTASACFEYHDMIQPIFDQRCIQCHIGGGAPDGIRWDTYAHAIADEGEVEPCDAGGSKLNDAVEDCDMPRDTMDDLCSTTACLTPSQTRLLRQWVNGGAHETCPWGGCP